MKLRSHVDEISRRGIRGWAFDEERPEHALELEVRLDGQRHAVLKADRPRPGLRERLGARARGDHAFALAFEPSLDALRDLDIEIVEAVSGQRLAQGFRRVTLPDRLPAPLRPILVVSTGRSGTTLLMSELLRHPRVIVANRYPYEMKLLSYYSAALRVLTADLDRVNSTNPDHIFDKAGRYRIGHNPFKGAGYYTMVKDREAMARLFEETVPARYTRMFADIVKGYYELVRLDQGKPGASHFAEKIDLDDTARLGPRLFFGDVREIALVRDPRDLLCSAKAFWKLDGGAALDMIRSTIGKLFAVTRSGAEDVATLRYEDLVLEPEASRRRLYQFIGLRDDEGERSFGDAALFERHGTSTDAASSIGRWRTDLSEEEVLACERMFADYMEVFGYAGSGRA